MVLNALLHDASASEMTYCVLGGALNSTHSRVMLPSQLAVVE